MIKLAKIWLSIWVKNQFIWLKNSEQILGWRPALCSICPNSLDAIWGFYGLHLGYKNSLNFSCFEIII